MSDGDVVAYDVDGIFYVEIATQRVLRKGQALAEDLTDREFQVLRFFLERNGSVVRYKSIEPLQLANVHRDPTTHYVSKINKKLGLKPNEYFKLVRRVGYRFEAEVRKRFQTNQDEATFIYKSSLQYFNHHTADSMKVSLAQCLKVTKEHPNANPKIWITQAYDYLVLGHIGYCAMRPEQGMPEARRAAKRALALNPRLARAHGALGLISLVYDFDWVSAENQLKAGLECDLHETGTLLAYAHLLVSKGHSSEAIKMIDRAVNAEPLEAIIFASWGWLYILAGQQLQGMELCEKARDAYPHLAATHVLLGLAYELNGRLKDAVRSYRKSLKLEASAVGLAWLGHLYAKTGKKGLALSTLKDLGELRKRGIIAYEPAYCRALVYAGLGWKERCLSELELAFTEHCDWLIHLNVDPRWALVRSEPRFRKIAKRVGLPDLAG